VADYLTTNSSKLQMKEVEL